jgi:hypothetical protein
VPVSVLSSTNEDESEVRDRDSFPGQWVRQEATPARVLAEQLACRCSSFGLGRPATGELFHLEIGFQPPSLFAVQAPGLCLDPCYSPHQT